MAAARAPSACPGIRACVPLKSQTTRMAFQFGPFCSVKRAEWQPQNGRFARHLRRRQQAMGHFVKSIYRHSRVTPRMQRQSTGLFPMFFSIHPDATGNTRQHKTKPLLNRKTEHIILQKEFLCVKSGHFTRLITIFAPSNPNSDAVAETAACRWHGAPAQPPQKARRATARQRANRGAADTGNAPCPTGATEKTNTKPAYGLFGLANKSNKQRLALKRQT